MYHYIIFILRYFYRDIGYISTMNSFTMEDLQQHLFEQLKYKTKEYQRAFHGRGGYYKGFEFLTIDYINTVLYVALFEAIDEKLEVQLLDILHELYVQGEFEVVLLQRRYNKKSASEVIYGILDKEVTAIENGLSYKLNFQNNQNIGFFADMKNGRSFIKENALNKKVLNLFSYTCAFSVCALSGGASKVVNVDMAKNALSIGRANHHLNQLDTKKVQFMPYNILKSWSRIKKAGPYDMIIIDPPSFQKGSFAATKDYEKIIKRLDELASNQCIVLACLNDPKLSTSFIKEQFKTFSPTFEFVRRLENLERFKASNEEQSLKNLVFLKQSLHTKKE